MAGRWNLSAAAAVNLVFLYPGGIMNRRGFVAATVLTLALAGLPGTTAAIEVGDKAPDFNLPSTKGGNFKLSDLEGKKNVVIQFYVIDFTPT